MYQKPTVTRFGSFRELTRVGGEDYVFDGFSLRGVSTVTPPVVTEDETGRS